eukprot:6548517-Pyramimonas_sp.AAC.1
MRGMVLTRDAWGCCGFQASAQSIAEMKEKLKILHNEVEILRGEIVNKEKLLAKAEVDHAAAVVDRNHLQTEMNK